MVTISIIIPVVYFQHKENQSTSSSKIIFIIFCLFKLIHVLAETTTQESTTIDSTTQGSNYNIYEKQTKHYFLYSVFVFWRYKYFHVCLSKGYCHFITLKTASLSISLFLMIDEMFESILTNAIKTKNDIAATKGEKADPGSLDPGSLDPWIHNPLFPLALHPI